jgi:hypothetical protein
MPETRRVIRSSDALDGVSDHMGEILRRADELLADWSRFGAQVKAQVDREAQQLGNAVARAVDDAVARATSTGVDRAIADQIGAKLAALSTEIVKLESRTRAASRAIAEDRRGDRRWLWAVAGGVIVANGLLVALLLREPPVPVVMQPEPTRIEPAVVPVDAMVEPASSNAPIEPSGEPIGPEAPGRKAEPAIKVDDPARAKKDTAKGARSNAADDKTKPPLRVKQGPPIGGAKLLAVPPKKR